MHGYTENVLTQFQQSEVCTQVLVKNIYICTFIEKQQNENQHKNKKINKHIKSVQCITNYETV